MFFSGGLVDLADATGFAALPGCSVFAGLETAGFLLASWLATAKRHTTTTGRATSRNDLQSSTPHRIHAGLQPRAAHELESRRRCGELGQRIGQSLESPCRQSSREPGRQRKRQHGLDGAQEIARGQIGVGRNPRAQQVANSRGLSERNESQLHSGDHQGHSLPSGFQTIQEALPEERRNTQRCPFEADNSRTQSPPPVLHGLAAPTSKPRWRPRNAIPRWSTPLASPGSFTFACGTSPWHRSASAWCHARPSGRREVGRAGVAEEPLGGRGPPCL
jgi:hypothetical protein